MLADGKLQNANRQPPGDLTVDTFAYSCGHKFAYTHYGHECPRNFGFLMISLVWYFCRVT